MFDLSKLSVKALGIIAAGATAVVLIVFAFSFARQQPVYFWGKEFGFSSKELHLKISALEGELTQARQQMKAATAEISVLKQANADLAAEQQRRRQHDTAMWYPVDEIHFYFDGSFTTSDGARQGTGKWTSKESELTLEFIDAKDAEAVLRTNLREPYNKLRLDGNGLRVRMKNFEYSVSTLEVSHNYVRVRVERRNLA